MSNFEKITTIMLFALFSGVVVLFVLYTRIDNNVKNLPGVAIEDTIDESLDLDETTATTSSITSTPSATIKELNSQVIELLASSSSLLERIEELEENPTTTSIVKSVTIPSFQKQIVYIGSASTKERDWSDSGVEVSLNSADYPSNVNAVFEVGLSVVGGKAWARLVNKTTGSIMAITEMSHSTSTTTWKSSPSFKLFSGNNIYMLEVRSTSGEVANFSGARIVLEK